MMLDFTEAAFNQLSIHHVGNKQQDGNFVLSDKPVNLQDELLPKLLIQYFLTPFSETSEVYRFYHPSDQLELNVLYHYIRNFMTENPNEQNFSEDFHALSKNICKHLYESSSHPKIKAGEVYIVFLENLRMEGETCSAIGIFKSENKETYLKVYPSGEGFSLDYEQEAININKLDKGCLILNSESQEGYKVLAIDKTNRQQEAVYWKDEFLQLKVRNDAFQQTGNFLNVYKQFVNKELDETFEMEKTDKMDLLNRSMSYFKENEVFKRDEFEEQVISDPKAIELFQNYSQKYGEEMEQGFDDEFEIANKAVRKMQSTYKSVLKLDKNFHVYVHGKREYIEKGFDAEKGLNFYKIYFEQEL